MGSLVDFGELSIDVLVLQQSEANQELSLELSRQRDSVIGQGYVATAVVGKGDMRGGTTEEGAIRGSITKVCLWSIGLGIVAVEDEEEMRAGEKGKSGEGTTVARLCDCGKGLEMTIPAMGKRGIGAGNSGGDVVREPSYHNRLEGVVLVEQGRRQRGQRCQYKE
ncbi:hypothetical protein B296_00037516 [Ensete ventricosum]|uniref:Uncharacterized protein n=1 Tax=Ensete ventricosum TaxID=4639 RepID=A0A426ZZG9_ENSVE|nr:hypothetical protein B296_00037516 [Ensete ventricosum]